MHEVVIVILLILCRNKGPPADVSSILAIEVAGATQSRVHGGTELTEQVSSCGIERGRPRR